MIKVAVVGLGQMGLSHQSLLGAHPEVDLFGVCDANNYLLGVLRTDAESRGVPSWSTSLEIP